MKKLDLSPIDNIIKCFKKAKDVAQSHDGERIDLNKETIFTEGPFLHQATETMSEDASAQFERDNVELFAYLRSLNSEFEDIF